MHLFHIYFAVWKFPKGWGKVVISCNKSRKKNQISSLKKSVACHQHSITQGSSSKPDSIFSQWPWLQMVDFYPLPLTQKQSRRSDWVIKPNSMNFDSAIAIKKSRPEYSFLLNHMETEECSIFIWFWKSFWKGRWSKQIKKQPILV